MERDWPNKHDNHEFDYDRDGDQQSVLEGNELKNILAQSLKLEQEMMTKYTIVAERVHDDPELKERLKNFAEGNAKRSRQLEDEIREIH